MVALVALAAGPVLADGTPPAADTRALRGAIEDLSATFGAGYPRGAAFLRRLGEIERDGAGAAGGGFAALKREALLANPLLDFGRLLVVRRPATAPRLGLPANWQGNSSLPGKGYDDAIAVVSNFGPKAKLATVYAPGKRFVGDVDLHFDADRLLFSMRDARRRWGVWELALDDSGRRAGEPKRLTPADHDDVDHYDGCYLPDGRIVFSSTACMTGVPCVRGSSHVANLYLLDPASGAVRRLCFDQDHNWCPTVLPTGRVLYTRWEYCDIPHAFSRILFHMNPDGTGQMEYYGSNSYWPNSIFYARPVPGSRGMFAGIVTGHHGVARVGELVLFDTARGRREAEGAVRRIPHAGQPVRPVLLDRLVDKSWPKFLHPWPLSAKYVLAAMQSRPRAPWRIVLADAFDNVVPLAEAPGQALLEPIPLAPRSRPPVRPDLADPARDDATVYLVDVHAGPGLAGVPRGTVRSLRVFTYHYAYRGVGGQQDRVGLDGPWDIKRILGTVPVRADGSACFRVPANTPISLQPLDDRGQAVQRMRSWFTAMGGEAVTCVGCHEPQAEAPPATPTLSALADEPAEIAPWYGPPRGFDFRREVQPVLDRYCIGCHCPAGPAKAIDLTDRPDVVAHPIRRQHGMGRFSPSYIALRRFVRAPTIESDLHMLPAWEFHAESTKLVQMLRKGHRGVRLCDEAWDRLITWIDLHAPAHGTWQETVGAKRLADQRRRRREMNRLYAGFDRDDDAIVDNSRWVFGGQWQKHRRPAEVPDAPRAPVAAERPTGASASQPPHDTPADLPRRTIDLGGGVRMALVRIPAGTFRMGDPAGHADERPVRRVRIDRAFWIGACEVTNAQFRRFDASHDSRLEHGHFLQFSVRERGWPLNEPNQPVVRVSWHQARAFCRWLAERTGERFDLPTEPRWEYACRAGTTTPLSYGGVGDDHAAFANLADARVKRMDKLGWNLPYAAIPPWHPTDGRFDDGRRVSAPVGSYRPNAWGLFDMHGNVCEWTLGEAGTGRRVVRGGSWYDRPKRARSAWRLSYRAAQTVYDVGFRVACPVEP